ncbi:MAG: hypothetical protein JO286_22760 [Solirubrobacterales bacterium]|nr:hypothetical protein [Solirubrobacterales bacterium]MBV9367862.1 hypothetical protein [Solirubrobacterales bacterium]MBV9810018.1 hypothetical protein [Solirubrobacterales bacterium]
MTAALTINIVLGALVLTAVIGMLVWSIATQNGDAATRIVRIARRRRPAPARARLIRRTGAIENRA